MTIKPYPDKSTSTKATIQNVFKGQKEKNQGIEKQRRERKEMIVVGSDVSFPFNLTRGRQPQYHERQNAFGRHFYQKSAVFRFSIPFLEMFLF